MHALAAAHLRALLGDSREAEAAPQRHLPSHNLPEQHACRMGWGARREHVSSIPPAHSTALGSHACWPGRPCRSPPPAHRRSRCQLGTSRACPAAPQGRTCGGGAWAGSASIPSWEGAEQAHARARWACQQAAAPHAPHQANVPTPPCWLANVWVMILLSPTCRQGQRRSAGE